MKYHFKFNKDDEIVEWYTSWDFSNDYDKEFVKAYGVQTERKNNSQFH